MPTPEGAALRASSVAERLSVGALGLALLLLIGGTWSSGAFYLVVRLGLPTPVQLAVVDGVHVYLGVVAAVLMAGKILRVRLTRRLRGAGIQIPWQRWISWSLLLLYGVVFGSGVLLLLPVNGRAHRDLVELHLLASVWAAVPTAWHLWHYRHRALPCVTRLLGRARRRRFWVGVTVAVAPALLVAAQSRAVTQLPQVGGGSTWSGAGLTGVHLDRLTVTPDGGTLLAAGDGLFETRDGRAWTRVDVPVGSGSGGSVSQAPDPTSGQHSHAPTSPAPRVQSLAASPAGIYVGTAEGLFFSPTMGGPFADVGVPGRGVRALAISPADPRFVWAVTPAGPASSSDGGHSWKTMTAGLDQPGAVSSITFLRGGVLASDPSGVFEWVNDSRSWARSSSQRSVIELSPSPDGRALYAISGTGELRVLAAGSWRTLETPGDVRSRHARPHTELRGVLPFQERLYATSTTHGVSASADGGQTWTPLDGALAAHAPAQATVFRGDLWVATADGLYRYPLAESRPASHDWWERLLAAAFVAGSFALVLSGVERPRPASEVLDRRKGRLFRGAEQYLDDLVGRPPQSTPQP